MSEYECSFYPEGSWVNDSCENVNCCLEGIMGACCLDEKCYNTSAGVCSELLSSNGTSGTFWGAGSRCAGPHEESRYYPYNCTLEGGTGGVGGVLDGDGLCLDGSLPPCDPPCIGWSQHITDDCAMNICACDGVDCHCASYTEDWGCNICGNNTDACGTIILASGECWECCCDTPTPQPPEEMGSCCVGRTCLSDISFWDCSEQDGTWDEEDCDNVNCIPEVLANCCRLIDADTAEYECVERTESDCNNSDYWSSWFSPDWGDYTCEENCHIGGYCCPAACEGCQCFVTDSVDCANQEGVFFAAHPLYCTNCSGDVWTDWYIQRSQDCTETCGEAET